MALSADEWPFNQISNPSFHTDSHPCIRIGGPKMLEHMIPNIFKIWDYQIPQINVFAIDFAFSCIFEILLHAIREPKLQNGQNPKKFKSTINEQKIIWIIIFNID